MKNNLLILFFCLLSCSVVAQQVISDDTLSTKRRTSSSFRSTVYYPWAYSAYSISDPVATTPIYHIGSLPAATIHSGSMAAQVTAPFATYSEPSINKRQLGDILDPGYQDSSSPLDGELVLLVFILMFVVLGKTFTKTSHKRQTINQLNHETSQSDASTMAIENNHNVEIRLMKDEIQKRQ